MDVKFPEKENPFPKTIAKAIVSVIIAFAIGLFLGNGLGALFGTDDSVITTSTYSDYMAATRSMFADPNQLDSYMNTAINMLDMDGLRLYSNKDRDGMLASWNGALVNADELFGEDVQRSLKEMMNTESALYGQETAAGNPIEGLRLYNLAVKDQVVYYYLYYDKAGYIAIAYDHNENVLTGRNDMTLQLTQNQEGDKGIWYLLYDMEGEE